MNARKTILLTLACMLAPALSVVGPLADEPTDAAAPEPVSYYKDIRPILQEHCQGCHQPARSKGKFIVTSYAHLMGEGRDADDKLIVPGKPAESPLLDEITPQDGEAPAMPKDASPLSEQSVELVARWIAEGAADDTPPEEKVEFTAAHPPSYRLPPVITSLDFSPDDGLLAVSAYHEVILHKGDGSGIAGRLVGLAERIESVAFSPDGTLLAVTGGSPARMGEVQIWDVEKRALRVAVPMTFDTLYGASWSGDGTRLAFGCADNSVRAVDVTTGAQVLFQGAHDDWVLGCVFSTDSSHLVSVSRDRSMKLIKVDTEQFIDNITSITPGALKGGLMAIDRHPTKDELLVGGADGTPKIYRMFREKARVIGDDYNLIRAFEAMPGRVFSVEFSSDGSRIAAGSSLDMSGEVRVYATDDGKRVSTWTSPQSAVYTVTFRSDGAVVAAGGFDGKVRLIDVATGELVNEFLSVPVSF